MTAAAGAARPARPQTANPTAQIQCNGLHLAGNSSRRSRGFRAVPARSNRPIQRQKCGNSSGPCLDRDRARSRSSCWSRWAAVMALLINRSYLQASSATLATDLARYTSAAVWHGVYYRGEKIGFTVSQTLKTDDGFELQEDGRLQMSLLGATTPVTIRTTAQVDKDFQLRSFEFSLDPGTGPIEVRGQLNGTRLTLAVTIGRQDADRGARADGAAGPVAQPVAAPRERRPRDRRPPSLDDLRRRHAAQRADRRRRRQTRARARAPARRRFRRSASRRSSRASTRRPGSPTRAKSCARRARSAC